MILSKKLLTLILPLIAAGTVFFSTTVTQAQQNAQFLTGNIMTAGNRSHVTIDWGDPIDAFPGDAIEFRVVAQNITPNTTITNVKVTANLPSNPDNPASTLVATGTVSGDNAAAVSDTVTVNVTGGSQQVFAYLPGHARIFSSSCPSGCSAPETVTSTGINVGNLGFGESAQVLFKAYVSNMVITPTPTSTPVPTNTPTPTPTGVPTATPTPVPSVTPTPTSTPGPTATPTPTSTPGPTATPTPTTTPGAQVQQPELQCPAGFVSTVSGSTIICLQQVQQQQQNQEVNITNNPSITNTNTVTAPAPQVVEVKGVTTAVSELPKTGLPLVAWGLGALLPVGLGLRKFGGRAQDVKKTADYLWQKREFSKD